MSFHGQNEDSASLAVIYQLHVFQRSRSQGVHLRSHTAEKYISNQAYYCIRRNGKNCYHVRCEVPDHDVEPKELLIWGHIAMEEVTPA